MWSDSSDAAKFRIGIGVIVLFIASVCMSWKELKYMMWAKTAEATVQRAEVRKDPVTEEVTQIQAIEYTFMDNDVVRREWSSVPSGWVPAEAVKVEYLSNKQGVSRLQGTSGKFWVWIILGMLGAGGLVFWKISRPA